MLLEKLKLEGFRRFHEPTELYLSGKMVAVVGSNEAGKTSLLKALSLASVEKKISYEDRTYLGTHEATLEYSYFLEPDDISAAYLSGPSWLVVTQHQDGRRLFEVKPEPERETEKRSLVEKWLVRFLANSKLRDHIEQIHGDVDYQPLELIVPVVSQKDGEYTDEQVNLLTAALDGFPDLAGTKAPAYVEGLPDMIRDLIAFERDHDPHQVAVDILAKRLPPVLYFGSNDRDIGLPYPLSQFRSSEPNSAPSKPLAQIINLSKLNMDALVDAVEGANDAVKTGLLAAANEELRGLSEGLWSQSDACLYLTISDGALDVMVEHKKGFEAKDRYNNLRDRSDGYRQFVALQIFAYLQSKSNAILLIDELEQHLHYDAQADLIQLLQNEKSVQKVIYTTHSAGALPEDLGSGVRMVQWDDQSNKYSKVNNKFWHRADADGFKPLLFGMGAATLAFFPTRKALIAEGATEMLLLPRLLREALGVEGLGFQIVHGLANISPKGLPMIDAKQSGIAYIVDGDEAGLSITKSLTDSKVDKSSIFNLKSAGCVTVEDLIDKKIWRLAVDGLLAKYNPGVLGTLSASHFPDKGRVKALPDLVSSRKVEIAYEILEIVSKDPSARVLSSSKSERLAKIGRDVMVALDLNAAAEPAV